MDILSIAEGQCRECYTCVRVCPVKAIKMTEGRVDIVEERCIYCGRCAASCSKKSIELGDDLEKAFNLLQSGAQTIAVLAPEYPASFYPMPQEQLAFLVEQAGFYGLEDTILGDELVAKQYLRHFAGEKNTPVIRSTCPAAVAWIEKYYPDLLPRLAPIVTPMLAQGRLIKSLYGEQVAVVYATPCIAAKAEAKNKTCGAIDAVLTFKEFKQLLRMRFAGLDNRLVKEIEGKPQMRRRYSVPGGFPRPTVARYNMLDSTLMVMRDVKELDSLANALRSGEIAAKFIDLLVCDGCISGPGIDSDLNIHLRKQIVEQHYNNRLAGASEQLTFDQVEPYIPRIDVHRGFSNRQVNLAMPSEQAIQEILAEGERFSTDDELNCGACGYPTCREQAIAIYQGISDWGACFPFKRAVYERIIQQLEETAVTDGLTGLSNHKSFLERLAVEFNRAQRYGSVLSIMMIDVDTFKEINDTFGHVTGDSVLKNVAKFLKSNIRQSDLAARYGGDEFAVILVETNLDQAYKVGEKLRRRVQANPIKLDPDLVVTVTLSIGVATYSPLMHEPVTLIKAADDALYQAKRGGRNQTVAALDSPVE